MAHGIGDVEAQVVLVQAKGVVEVAADAVAQDVVDGKAYVRDLRHRLRQEARLDALGQLQFVVELLVELPQARVDAMHLGRPPRQAVVGVLDAQQCPYLGRQLAGRQGMRQAGVGSAFQGRQAGGRRGVVGDEQQWDESLVEASAEAAAQVQGRRAAAAGIDHDEAAAGQVVGVGRADGVPGRVEAGGGQERAHLGQGRLAGTNEDRWDALGGHRWSPGLPLYAPRAAAAKGSIRRLATAGGRAGGGYADRRSAPG